MRNYRFDLYALDLHIVHPIQTTGTQDSGAPPSLRSRKLTHVDGVPQLPEKMVYKLSYQTEGHPSEGTLFSRFLDQFGIVDIIGFHTCSEEFFGTTAHHFSNPRFLKLLDKSEESVVGTPEIRQLHCTVMALEGLPLLDILDSTEADIPTPAELVETILHSMIGE